MATEESNIQQKTRIVASKHNACVFRNNRGFFVTIDCIDKVRAAVKQPNIVKAVLDAVKTFRKVRAGLEVAGAPDLVGWRSVTITPDMVGKKVAIFCAPEIKTPQGRVSPDQQRFFDNVKRAGGMSDVIRSEEDAHNFFNKLPF